MFLYRMLFFVFFLSFFSVKAKLDSISTDEVVITAKKIPIDLYSAPFSFDIYEKEQINNMPVQSISDILENSSSLDIRNRGKSGMQSDISLRGSSFNQTLIMLDGIPINDPHTGHHSMNMTISPDLIERVEIIKAGSSKSLGINSFSGAINFVTKKDTENSVNIDIQGGEFGYYNLGLNAAYNYKNLNNLIFINKNGSDGFTNNTDHQSYQFGLLSNYKGENSKLSLNASFANRMFGANSFYTPAYPNQYEQTITQNISLTGEFGSKFKNKSSVFYRSNYDRFELYRDFKDAASWYADHNYHLSEQYGVSSNFSFNSDYGITSFGFDLRNEEIFSTVLGNPIKKIRDNPYDDTKFNKYANRLNSNIFVEQNYKTDKFNFVLGTSVFNNSDYGTYINPGFEMSYRFNSNKFFTNLNQNVRIPTFTELYYSGPTNLGNPNLNPEKSISLELGHNYFSENININSTLFYRIGENMIDWNRSSDTVKWQTNNLTNIDFYGLDVDFTYNFHSKNEIINIKNVKLNGMLLQSNKKEEGNVDSYYVLDYLNYKVGFSTLIEIIDDLIIYYSVNLQKRNGNFLNFTFSPEIITDYKEIFLSDLKINYSYKNANFYIDINNLFDEKYFDIANVPLAGRWTSFGVRYSLK